MITFLNILEKFKLNKTFILITAGIFTLFWAGTYGTNGTIEIYQWMGHKAVYYDFVFFYMGYYLRTNAVLSDKSHFLAWLLFIVSTVYILVLNNTVKVDFDYSLIWIFFNLSLIYLVILGALKYQTIKLPLVTWMGTMSLPIYLLHIIPLLLLKPFVDNGILSPYLHIILYFTGVAIVMFSIFISKNTKFGKMLILGERIQISGTKK
jgi:peptidoglycan/LPS O-acetylase OafA/YrhL